MCGLLIETQGDQVVSVRGDPDDVLSRGHICPKGAAIGEVHSDPDRLTRPMLRQGDTWREIGWKEAMALAAERLGALRQLGSRSVAVYVGNPAVHNPGALMGARVLLKGLSTRSRYTASSVDQLPKQVANWLLYGHQLLFGVPDLDRCDLLVMFGANPLASNGSLMTAPDIRKRLRAIQSRGRVVVVDPRRTRTAELADAHHFIRPGTDAFVLAAMARELLLHRREEPMNVRLPVANLDALHGALAPFTPEVAERHSGVPAQVVADLARDLLRTERAALYARIGTCTQEFGTLNQWLVDVVNLLAGNLDREGGVMFPQPAVDFTANEALAGPGHRDGWRSRVRGAPEAMGELPVATLAEDITAPGDDRVRALITVAGNPVLSTPGGDKLGEALDQLEFMVSVDPYLNETTRHAHLVLPPTSSLCHGHYDVVFHGFAIRDFARWSDPVFDPPQDGRGDWEILSELAVKLAWSGKRRRRALVLGATRLAGLERLLDLGLRTGPYRLSLKKVRAHPHGLDLGPLRPNIARRMRAEHLDLAPSLILEEIGRLNGALDAEVPPLVLIGRRHLRSNNSWMHNAPTLAKGKPRCTLLVHPDDAKAHGVEHGGNVRITSRAGEVVAPAEVSDEVMRGVVSLPHGWGHDDPDTRLSVATRRPGANVNVLTDPDRIEPLSGTAVLNGVPVQISPA